MKENSAIELQCNFFVVRKKRLCRMTVRPGRQYCGEHEPQPKTEEGHNDKRIPCPYDAKHTCYASKLQKHLTICNSRPGEAPPYIVPHINAPRDTEDIPRKPLGQISKELLTQVIDKVNFLFEKYIKDNIESLPDRPIHSTIAEDFGASDRTETSLRHMRQGSRILHIAQDEGLVRDQTCYVELGAGRGQLSYYTWLAWCSTLSSRSCVVAVERAATRHKRDNKLPIMPVTLNPSASANNTANVIKETYVTDNPTNVTNDPMNATNDPTNVTNDPTNATDDPTNVTNSPTHSNVTENLTTNEESKVKPRDEVSVVRVRADLAHVRLSPLRVVQESKAVVGLAKHLCGVAMDFAIRCLSEADLVQKTSGAVLATCCHHRCDRHGYVANTHLKELGISGEEFNIILGIVSWATCGDGRSRDNKKQHNETTTLSPGNNAHNLLNDQLQAENTESGSKDHKERLVLSQEYREEVGRRAKSVIDWGRVLYLREKGFDARLCYYVPTAVTLENICIIAKVVS